MQPDPTYITPTYITTQARQLVEQHGEGALALAEDKFHELMNMHDVKAATTWLGITHEVQAMLLSNAKS